MALIKSCLASGGGGYDIVELIPYRVASGGTYSDKNITAQVDDYLALTSNISGATLANANISETSDVTITGAEKVYKVTQAMSSASVRILVGESGGAILHFRTV